MFDLTRLRLQARRRRREREHAERLDRYVDRRLGLIPTRACASAARATYVGDDTLLCWVQGRYHLFASSRDVNLTPPIARFGRVSPWLSRVIAQAVRPGMVVADVGANIGYHTMQLADRVGPGGRVLAFEPNLDLARLVWRSLQANGLDARVDLHAVALGAVDGERAWLCTNGDSLAGAGVHDAGWAECWTAAQRADPGGDHLTRKAAREITVRRLDAVAGADGIAFAKIDVEGFEPEVWAGMTSLLAGDRLRTVVLEYTPTLYVDPAALLDGIAATGWSVALIDPDTGPASVSRAELEALGTGGAHDLLLTR